MERRCNFYSRKCCKGSVFESLCHQRTTSLVLLVAELTGRAILIGGQTSDMHVTAKLEP